MKSREDILGGSFLRMVQASGGVIPITPDEDLRTGQAAALASAPDSVRGGGDAWVFGYGSLMWNPAIRYQESRIAMVRGYHRRFCLWSPVGRGCAVHPGLVLGLTRGGSCKGVAYRIKGCEVAEEFSILWQREMISDGYIPRWIRLHTAEEPLDALTFVINRACPRYAGRLPDEEAARAIAAARGALGSNTEYLLSTVEHLDALGIPDRRLHSLKRRLLECP
ncbi:MAG: gamma-glutamylcyclotransferase [Rhodospirillaceae bacterium]